MLSFRYLFILVSRFYLFVMSSVVILFFPVCPSLYHLLVSIPPLSVISLMSQYLLLVISCFPNIWLWVVWWFTYLPNRWKALGFRTSGNANPFRVVSGRTSCVKKSAKSNMQSYTILPKMFARLPSHAHELERHRILNPWGLTRSRPTLFSYNSFNSSFQCLGVGLWECLTILP